MARAEVEKLIKKYGDNPTYDNPKFQKKIKKLTLEIGKNSDKIMILQETKRAKIEQDLKSGKLQPGAPYVKKRDAVRNKQNELFNKLRGDMLKKLSHRRRFDNRYT